MAQQVRFGIPEPAKSAEGGSIFGSRFVTSTENSNLFGGQSEQMSTARPNVFETLSGQTGQSDAPFGSFVGRTAVASPIFGSIAEMETKRDGKDVFGGVNNLSGFGGQTGFSQPSSGASSTIFGSNFGFGTAVSTGQAVNQNTSTASHVFGTAVSIGQAANQVTSTASRVFGAAVSMGQAANQNTSTASHVFGTAVSMGQAANQITSTSHVFGATGSVPASNPFGTSQPSMLFSSNNQPSSNVFTGNTSSSTPVSFGTGQSDLGQLAFSVYQPTIEGSTNVARFSTSSVSSPPFSMQNSNVFGSFSSNSAPDSNNSGPLFAPSSTGLRKRDSNGIFGGNTLFGKQDVKAPVQSGSNTGTSTAPPPFTMKHNVAVATAPSQFQNAISSQSHPVSLFTSSTSSTGVRQSGDIPLFGQKHSDIPVVEQGGTGKVLSKFQPEFLNVQGVERSQTAEAVFQAVHSVSDPHISSSQAPFVLLSTEGTSQFARKDPVSSRALFGNLAKSGSSKPQGFDGLFEKSVGRSSDQSQSTLFGKPIHKTGGALFGKGSKSQSDLGKGQADSAPKSLSKWSRGKDGALDNRKRREATSELEYTRDFKKSKAFESETSASPPAAISRSSSLRASVDDLSPKNSLVVKDIPSHLNRVPVLRRHFSQFGTVIRLQPLPMKRAANITFKTHEEALAAKNDGKYLVPGDTPLSIFWRANSKLKSPDEKKSHIREREYQRGAVLPRKKPVPGSVEDELASMSELPDFQEEIQTAPKQHDMPKVIPARKRSPTPPPAPQVLDVDVARGLLKSIYKARAKDTAEKVAILDSRDKLLRLLRGRQQSDLATAKAFVGTCPDMCPEKERHYREDIRRLSVYEVIPSTMTSLTGLKSKVDHIHAVKEYSRSSADQDEPLSHELRPLSVLVTTMNYLLTRVADLGEDGKWSEWYDFLWNRTRGIRKDITQQQLCDVQVAELLEKCARFHIFCSERLCEEDMMTFDAKINNENLTKCLQTLKELYADLEKRGTVCPNEAEFRGYMVLMNLNEGDILREIQQLRPEIRDSPHISFAVQVYNALNTNNYVRFFRLIEEKAPFLSACILHRYFNQIRSKALYIIMKAHGALGKTVLYPVEELIRLLCFEDAREVEAFCYHYCLSLRGVDVVLDSKSYTEPESSLRQTRSQSLIEIKQENVSVGEVLNGSPLPLLQLPYPSSSFDEDGVFIMSSDIQETLDSSKLFRPKPSLTVATLSAIPAGITPASAIPTSVEETRVQREKMLYSNEVVKSLARFVILEVIDASLVEIAQETVKEESDLSVVIMSEIEDMVNLTAEESLRQVAEEVYEEQESKLRQKLEEELAAQKESACAATCETIVSEAVAEMIKAVAEAEMSLVKAELHRQQVERCSQQCSEEMLRLVVDEVIEDVCADVYDVDVVIKRERLEATEKLVEMFRLGTFFQAWKMKYLAQVRIKRAMLDFPSAPSTISLKEQIEKLVPFRPDKRISQKAFYISERSRLSIASPMDVIQEQLHLTVHLSMASARHMLDNLLMWRPLDMNHAVNAPMQRVFKSWRDSGVCDPDTACLQWKLVVSLPKSGRTSSTEETTFYKWVRAKLCRSADRDKLLRAVPSYEGEVLSSYQLSESGQKPSTISTGICVRCFHGAWTDNEEISVKEKCLVKGTSAVMFILSSAESLQSKQQATWQRERQRLHQVLKQKPQSPAVPLVVIVPRVLCSSSVSVQELDENLELSGLYRQKLITAVHVAEPFLGDQTQLLQCFRDWTTHLTDCLRFAATNIPAPPKLQVKPVSDYIEDIVVEFYKTSVYEDLRARSRKQLLHQSPNTLLSLYNDVVDHAAMTSASGSLVQISWPVPEFDQSVPTGNPKSSWNTEAYLCDLYELVSKMRLPYFRYSDMEADDWSTVCQDVWSYVAAVTKKDSGYAKIYLHQQVAELLCRVKQAFHQFCWLAYKDGPCEPTYINMAWTDLIDACIHYKLVSLRTGHIALRRHEAEDELAEDSPEPEEAMVYYQEAEIDDWEPPQIWQEALMGTETSEPGLLKTTVERAAEVVEDELSEGDQKEASAMDESVPEATPSSSTLQQGQTVQDKAASSWAHLKILLEEEKAASEKYEKSLEFCLSQSSTSVQMNSLDDPSYLGQIVSPILSDKYSHTRHPRNAASQPLSFSDRRQKEFGDSFRASQGFPYHLGVSSPESSSFSRTPGPKHRGRESADARDGGGHMSSLSSTLSERVLDLQCALLSEKQAGILYEMRLKSFIDPVLDTTQELH